MLLTYGAGETVPPREVSLRARACILSNASVYKVSNRCRFRVVDHQKLTRLGSCSARHFPTLLLKRACVTGDAHPLAIQVNPGIRESPVMIERLTFIEPFGVIDSSYDSGVPVYEDPLVRVCHKAGSVGKILIVGQELGLRHERAIIVSADEGFSHQPI